MGEPARGEQPKRIVFKDADGQIRWFSTDQIELVWVDYALPGKSGFGDFDHLALLPGNKWVLYDEPTPFDVGPPSVRFVAEGETLDWLLKRGHEPPACLTATLSERCVVEPSDKRNENRLLVLDEDDGSRPVVIDVSGAQQWGPAKADSGDYDPIDQVPQWFYSDTLYRLSSGRFARVRERAHREADIPFEPEVKRFSDEEAARWLLFQGFEPPADIAHLAENHRFKDDPPQARKSGDDGRNRNVKQVSDEDDGNKPVVIDTTGAQKWGPFFNLNPDNKSNFRYDLYRLANGQFVRIGYVATDDCDYAFDERAKRMTDDEAARLLTFGAFEPPADIAHLADKHRFKAATPAHATADDRGRRPNGQNERQFSPDDTEVEMTNRSVPKCKCGGSMITTTTKGNTQYRKCDCCGATGKTRKRS